MRHNWYGRVLLLAAFLAWAVPAAAASPQKAPLNPAFPGYLAAKAGQGSSTLMESPSGSYPESLRHALGYVPEPVSLPHLSSGSTTALSALPAIYDLRALGRVTSVKDQGTCKSDWAFAAMASAESNLLPDEVSDFSENNLKNNHGFVWGPCEGGNPIISMAYFARWAGPVKEGDDPYNPTSGVSPSNTPVQKRYTDISIVPQRQTPTDSVAIDRIKQAVMNYGAVMSSYYHDDLYYDAAHYGYYFPGPTNSNHTIAIVGWDDNFSSANFRNTPPGNGAFIIKNSWGTGWGEGGYFYISYYDTQLGRELNWVFKKPVAYGFNRAYQYDPLGWTQAWGYGLNTAWFSNVFTAAGGDDLAAVSFYAISSGASYQIDVYTNVTGSSPTSGTYAGTTTGTMAEAGYHTVPLAEKVRLAAGEKFSAVVKLTTPDTTYPVPTESTLASYATTTANAGESFISADGSDWTDLTAVDPGANVCLKAFTTAPGEAVPAVTATSPEAGAIGVPATAAVTATFNKPVNPASVTAGSFLLAKGAPVPGTVSYNPDTLTAVFTPSVPLTPNTTYTATVTSAVTDPGGTAMAGDMTWSFTTAATSSITFDGLATRAAVPAGYGGVNWGNFYSFDTTAAGPGYRNATVTPPSVAYNGQGLQASISGSTPFDFNGAYLAAAWNNGLNIRVRGYRNDFPVYDRTVVTDTLAAAYFTFNYMGVDRVTFDSFGGVNAGYSGTGTHFAMDNCMINGGGGSGPAVVSTVPANAGTIASVYAPIKVIFSTAAKASTINQGTFKVGNYAGAIAYDPATRTATFQPATALPQHASITATVTTGVTDENGVPMAEDYSWTFTTPYSYTLSGIVHSGPYGPGLAGATVKIEGYGITRTATTSSTGAYAIPDIPARGDFTVTVSRTGYLTYTGAALGIYGNTSADFTVLPLYGVSGTVHSGSAAGPGLAGATVSLAGRSVTSGSNGVFSIAGVPQGTWTLTVEKEGYSRYTDSAFAVNGARTGVNPYIVPVTYSVSGVLHSGSASGPGLASAAVSIAGKTAYTTATGAFTVAGVPPGTWTLIIAKTGYSTFSQSWTVTGNITGLKPYLTPVYSVAGTVRAGSPTGALLPGATVTLAGKSVTTGSNGTFIMANLVAGNHTITISAPGYSTYSASVSVAGNLTGLSYYVTTTPMANLAPFQPGGWSDKVVVAAAPGVTSSTGTQFYTADNLYVAWAWINNGTGAGAPFYTGVYVDGVLRASYYADTAPGVNQWSNGQVSIGQLPAGAHIVKVVLDATGLVPEVSEGDNSYTKTVNVVAPPSYAMSGTVRSPTGTGPALAGATVSIAGKSAATSSTGAFSLGGIPAGTYALTVSKAGYAPYTVANYKISGNQTGLVFVLQKARAALSVSLLPVAAYGDRLWSYAVQLNESAGVGVTIDTVTWKYYDANNTPIGTQTADGAYFANLLGNGSARIAANGSAGGTLFTDLGGRSSGSVAVTFTGTDDNGNRITASGTEYLKAPLQAPQKEGAQASFTTPATWGSR